MYVRQYVQQHANVDSESPYTLKVLLSLWCGKAQRHFNIDKAPIPVKILKYYSTNQYFIQYNILAYTVSLKPVGDLFISWDVTRVQLQNA